MRLLRRFARRVGYRLFHWGIRGRLDGVHVAADAGRRAVRARFDLEQPLPAVNGKAKTAKGKLMASAAREG